MDRRAVLAVVRETLAAYQYEPPPAGTTVGIPWSEEKVREYVEKLKSALVEPFLQRFELREMYEQVGQQDPTFAEYWVVAKSGNYLEWWDPVTGEFGLGERLTDSNIPVSIGVRGDLVATFCAM